MRWVDIYGGGLEKGELLALLNPICRGQLTDRMARDLITHKRFATGGGYRKSEVVLTSAFRVRHLRRDPERSSGGDLTSVFEPIQLLVGEDWLLSCWHPPRVFHGLGDAGDNGDDSSNGLYLDIARRWPATHAKSAKDLAALVQRQLAIANGYRNPRA